MIIARRTGSALPHQAVQQVQEDYRADDRVQTILYDNTDFAAKRIETLPPYDYNGLKEKLHAILDAEYAAGTIDEAEYRAVAKTAPPARSDAGKRGSGSKANRDNRPEQSEGLVANTRFRTLRKTHGHKRGHRMGTEPFGAPGGIRTPGLQLRKLPLYPTELRARERGV